MSHSAPWHGAIITGVDPDARPGPAGGGAEAEPTENADVPADEVDEWELESFPASDPPANW